MGRGCCSPRDQLRAAAATPRSPRAAHLDPVRPLRLPWLSHTTPTRHGFLPSGPVCIFPSGLLLDVRQGSLKTRGWILRVLTRSPSGCCRLRAGHLDRASPCGLGFPTARWQGSQAKCQENRGVIVQLLSRVRLFVALWTAARQASLSFTSSLSLLKLISIESMMPSNHLILCCPLLLPSIFPSFRVFSSESVLCMRWPECWSFRLSISPSTEYLGLIYFRMDWLDLLAVQETLKSLLQHHSSKVSIFQHSPFFMVQLSHLYMTTGKTIALTRWTFVSKVMSLLFNMLSRLVIAFLPRSKHLEKTKYPH